MDNEEEGSRGHFQSMRCSFLIRAAVVHRVDHEEKIGSSRHQRVARLYDLETHVVEGLGDGH